MFGTAQRTKRESRFDVLILLSGGPVIYETRGKKKTKES